MMKTISRDSCLLFKDLTVKIKDKDILTNISGTVSSGDLLAVMGPTGSGKTTLLNALAGRISINSGQITLNGFPFGKAERRRLGYVMQDDIFLTNLTLWETLYFTAMIRISDKVPEKQKIERINNIVSSLGLQKCLHTAVGDSLNPGLSGGEKKRANIACELLTDPDILLLDEPTSGLDSSSAHNVMKQLKNYAHEFNKTIITTIHQPSSQIFHLFSSLLLLVEGRTAYFGLASSVIDHFSEIGMTCGIHYNPADFLLELLTSDPDTIKKIEDNVKYLRICDNTKETLPNKMKIESDDKYIPGACKKETASEGVILRINGITDEVGVSLSDVSTNELVQEEEHATRRWPTSTWTQLKMLYWRCFKQSKGRILHKIDVIQALVMALVTGAAFFQLENSTDLFRDKMGLLFFTTVYWGYHMMLITIVGFPGERPVVHKERAAGAYRLSAYYLSKIVSELPLLLIVPLLFNTAVYWMSGLGDVEGYFVFLAINILNCLFMQSIGHIIGASIASVKLSMMTLHIVVLSSILLGGFYNIHPPEWLKWGKYASFIYYPYGASAVYFAKFLEPVRCNATSVAVYPQCLRNSTDILTPDDILNAFGIDSPIQYYILIIVSVTVVARILGYYILRWKRI